LVFQTAVGIPVTSKNPYSIYKNNRGIYPSVVYGESYSKWAYHLFETVVTSCLILQILLAATLTALGAASSSHIIITAFGAVNTALAGTVALLKGQGLPNRLRQDWNSWRDLRDCIEEKEREIGCGKPGVDVWAEIKIIEDRYEAVRKNQEKNRPDMYTHLPDKDNDSSSGDGTNGESQKGGNGQASF
jgi:SMODS and SLOG-associating 2TM effector domain